MRFWPGFGASVLSGMAGTLSQSRLRTPQTNSPERLPYTADRCPHTCIADESTPALCDGVVLPVSAVGEAATSPETVRAVLRVVSGLSSDAYTGYTVRLYREGIARLGDDWRYADIVTALHSAASFVRPRRYLEIGVRQGRSMAVVAAAAPKCQMVGFDRWMENYGDAPNPGPDLVRAQLAKVGFLGSVEFVSGDSHSTLPAYFRAHPAASFDLITVDGDHSRRGAAQDLGDVLPHLAIGGILVFDDIVHPLHTYLSDVWFSRVARDPRFACWKYDELGYGVALAIRRW